MSCCFIMPHLTLFLGPSALACLPACPPACPSACPPARPSARPSWADPYTCSSWVEPLDFTRRFFSFLPRFAGSLNPPFLFFLGALPHFRLPPRRGWSRWISQNTFPPFSWPPLPPITCSSWVEPLDFTTRFFSSFLPRPAGSLNSLFLFFCWPTPPLPLTFPPWVEPLDFTTRFFSSCWISQLVLQECSSFLA